MKLCACEHNVPGDSFAERVRYLAQHRVEGIELTIGDRGLLLGSLKSRVKEIAEGCAATGVKPAIITTKITDLLDIDPARRNAAKAEVRDHIETAAQIGALGVSIVPRFGPPSLPDLSPLGTTWEIEHKLFVMDMRPLAEQAERLGIVLTIEPLNRYLTKFLQTVSHAKRICLEVGSPAMKILIDNFQSYYEETSIHSGIRSAGKLLGHVHISENTRRLPPQGSTDFKPIVAALREVGYDGYLSFECDVSGAPVAPQFEAALTHMRQYLAA